MRIIETNLKFRDLSPLGVVNKIVVHHSVTGDVDAKRIHDMHLNNGWSGIGYHFVVKMNGEIERGRPENKLGAHVANQNSGKIGVCFIGDFSKNKMSDVQKKSGIEIINYLKNKYNASICKHSDLMATNCPGNLFPYNEIVNSKPLEESKPTNPPKPNNTKKLWEISIQGQEVKDLQKVLKVTVDGYFGDNTLKACPLLKSGSSTSVVKLMQKRLLNRGYSMPKYGADGHFGQETLSAIKRLQDCFNLDIDGIVGKNTWKALYGLDKGRF